MKRSAEDTIIKRRGGTKYDNLVDITELADMDSLLLVQRLNK